MTRSTAAFLAPLSTRPGLPRALVDRTTGAVVARVVEPALDARSRGVGLLGRDSLPEDRALLLAPCWSIHTFFMRFAIDVVFVDRSGRVLKVRERMPRGRMTVRPGAFAVVELAAGTAARAGLTAGHLLALE